MMEAVCCTPTKKEKMRRKKNFTLRRRTLRSGNVKLYVDITGGFRRKTESLGLFLVPELTRADRAKNKETLRMAEAAVAKMVVDEQRGRFGFESEAADEVAAIDYIEDVAERARTHNTRSSYLAMASLMCRYDRHFERMSLAAIDRVWLLGFRTFLATEPFRPMTRVRYWSTVNAILNRAVKDGLLPANPAKLVEGFGSVQTERNYLTTEELRRLAATPCSKPTLKRAFLFACVTGLRISDIRQLRWGMVLPSSSGWRLGIRQQKTDTMVYVDLSRQALRLMGDRPAHADGLPVFDDLPRTSNILNFHIDHWVRAAGITRHITFHCSRHTFAVSLLASGTDIYTVSNLLGHANLSTTQVYAHIVDERKRAAIEALPEII